MAASDAVSTLSYGSSIIAPGFLVGQWDGWTKSTPAFRGSPIITSLAEPLDSLAAEAEAK
jgi:hypothetical protein